jgi:hypothetical protein
VPAGGGGSIIGSRRTRRSGRRGASSRAAQPGVVGVRREPRVQRLGAVDGGRDQPRERWDRAVARGAVPADGGAEPDRCVPADPVHVRGSAVRWPCVDDVQRGLVAGPVRAAGGGRAERLAGASGSRDADVGAARVRGDGRAVPAGCGQRSDVGDLSVVHRHVRVVHRLLVRAPAGDQEHVPGVPRAPLVHRHASRGARSCACSCSRARATARRTG